jgi:pimeloyl-ACP methyl ester carboxylesterase
MDAIDVDGLRIAFARAGSGPALVLLHGYVGDGATTWRPQLDGLSDRFTVIAWDAPGAGGSSDPPETLGMAGYADLVAGFVTGLGLQRPCVGGLSFGGALTLEVCRRHPSLAGKLVLASAYAGWGGSLPPEEADRRVSQAMTLSALSADEYVATLLPSMFSPGTSHEVVQQFGSSMRAFHPAGFRAMARASAADLRPALAHVHVPSLLVYGEQDVRAPLTVARRLHSAIPGSRLVVLPSAGHLCNLEAPDDFNSAVRAFLERDDR